MQVSIQQTEPRFVAETPRPLLEASFDIRQPLELPNYDISRDRQRFLMIKPTEETEPLSVATELRVVENWFEELRRLAPPSEGE